MAYLGMPSKTARTVAAQQRADQNWAQLRLEQVASQLQIAAELARGMALTLGYTSDRSEPALHRLIDAYSARDRVDAALAWGVSDLDACLPTRCVVARGHSAAESLPPMELPDPPLVALSQDDLRATMTTGQSALLIDNGSDGSTRLIIAAYGFPPTVPASFDAVGGASERPGAAFVVIDFARLASATFDSAVGHRLLATAQRESLPQPAPGQQQVTRAVSGIYLALYFPATNVAGARGFDTAALWLTISVLGVAVALLREQRTHRRRLRLAALANERDALRATAEVIAQRSAQHMLICDIANGTAFVSDDAALDLAQAFVRPSYAEFRVQMGACLQSLTFDKARLRIAPDRIESGSLTATPMPQLGESTLLLDFSPRTELEAVREQLQRSQRDDFLTGVLCRRAFIERMSALIDEPSRPTFALVGLEVASLGMINALHGVAAGDLALQRIAQRLLANSRDLLFAGRVEDDLFACVWAVPVPEVVTDRINHISATVRAKPVEVPRSGGNVSIDVDVWVAATFVGSTAWCDGGVLLSRLGEALARSRTSALRTHLFSFDGNQVSDRAGDAAWLDRIRQAMRDESLVLFGQRVLPRDGSGLVPHAEVLLRLRASDGSIIPPGAFLPIAERYELIREVDRYVVSRAFRHLDALISQFAAPDGVLAINLSARTLSDPGLLAFLQAELSETGIDPRRVCLEVTESAAFGDLDWTCNLVAEIRRLGLRVAIDDFGVGMASFSYLQRVPADYVKIDGSFVKDITSNVLNQRIVQAVTEIGHAVNMRVIAEWVSNAAIRDALETIGVDYLQGFHLHTPQIADFELRDIQAPRQATGQDGA